jgi:hypothetical protein
MSSSVTWKWCQRLNTCPDTYKSISCYGQGTSKRRTSLYRCSGDRFETHRAREVFFNVFLLFSAPNKSEISCSKPQAYINILRSNTTPALAGINNSKPIILDEKSIIRTPKMSAAQQVFGVAELLEEILDNLSIGDILCNAQAVCTVWRDCISRSSPLKKHCFLLPSLKDEQTSDDQLFMKVTDHDCAYMRFRSHDRRIFVNGTEIPYPKLAQVRAFMIGDVSVRFQLYRKMVIDPSRCCSEQRIRFDRNSGTTQRYVDRPASIYSMVLLCIPSFGPTSMHHRASSGRDTAAT